MNNAWERASSLADKHANQGGIFVRLADDGDKVVGAFCGEPYPKEVVWTGEQYEDYDPDVHTDKRPSLRVALNFWVPSEGEMKIIEGGTVWFKDVLKVRGKYGLDKWLFEIERHGAAGDPKTKYSILPEEKLTAEQLQEIASIALHDIGNPAEASQDTENDGPVPKSIAMAIMARLKKLQRVQVEAWLKEFGLAKVSDLKLSQQEAAEQLLTGLETPDADDDIPF